MEKKFVEYNGTQVIEGWPERIEEAQLQPTYSIGGSEHQRIRYGEEEDE